MGTDGGLIKHYGDRSVKKGGRRGYEFKDNAQGVFTPVGDAIKVVQLGASTAAILDGKFTATNGGNSPCITISILQTFLGSQTRRFQRCSHRDLDG